MKKPTTLTIESDLIDEMKEKHINMSETAENAFREELQRKVVKVDPSTGKCQLCNREHFLMWVLPQERWLCEGCIRSQFQVSR